MQRYLFSALLALGLLLLSSFVSASLSEVPEPFQGFDPDSKSFINYADLNALLKSAVVDTGRSSREVAKPTEAKTGTRMKTKVKTTTINEGNRFYYEIFDEDDESHELLIKLRDSLASVPDQVPLDRFTRDEQLAYWLNLYNITMINEVAAVYPQRSLKKLLLGKKAVLDKKVLTVAGIPLSLNDIQHTILAQNYDNNDLILYGLYQGIIGGPSIRKSAYTGRYVYRNLELNAREFVNSNRGTYFRGDKLFQVSSLYDRNSNLFPDFDADLRNHLVKYLEGYELSGLAKATRIKADISDWTVTDLYGSYREMGGSLADNRAALLDSVVSTLKSDQQIVPINVGVMSNNMVVKTRPYSRFSPDLVEYLTEIQAREESANLVKDTTVTVEELGVASEQPPAEESEGGRD